MRAAVLDVDGRLLGRAARPLETLVSAPGRAEQDPRAWRTAALETGREAVGQAGEIEVAAVGVGALGPAPVLVDAQLQPLTPALLFALDRRAEAERARLGVGDDHALPKLLWWREHEPDLFGRAEWALDAAGFVVAELTGEPVMDSITHAAYEHGEVDAGISLPPPLDPQAVAGRLRAEAAEQLGLSAATPVAVGTYDTYVDVAGTGVGPGEGCLLLGSTLAVYAIVTDAAQVPGLELTRYPGEGRLLGGTTTAAGSVLRWLTELLDGDESELADAADKLEPGSGGVLALPHLAGERAPFSGPQARGALVGLSLATRRADVYRAFVDALALSALSIAELLPERRAWRVSGGGCMNRAWLRATCDALGLPLQVMAYAGEAVGAAVLALRSVSLDPPTLASERLEPRAERTRRYQMLHDGYRELHERLREQ